jgi:hypothetical protein
MLLLDTFITLFKHDNSNPLPVEILEHLSITQITAAHLAQAEAKKDAAYRQLFFEMPKERIAQAQKQYTQFLIACRAALGKRTETPLLPLAFDHLGEQDAYHACFQVLTFNLSEQTQALAIAPLGRQFISNPVCFSAFLRWLITHGASVDEIISTHILQDYVRYYLISLQDEDNSIQALYQALKNRPDTLALSVEMETTCCPENELSSYSLHGIISNPEALNNPKKHVPLINITATPTNTAALTHLFGTRFLIYILQSQQQLELLKHLLLNEFLHCLDVLTQNTDSAFDLVSDLMPLFNFFTREDKNHASLIFDVLIDAFVKAPDLLEDETILYALRRFKPAENKLNARLRAVEKNFEQLCQHESFDVIDLEDAWYKALDELHVIQAIFPATQTTLPTDKFSVYGHVAQIQLKKHGVWFNLNDFIIMLNIEPTKNQTAITPYERLLIELLITLDSPHLRVQIIQKLTTAIEPPRHFKNTTYADTSLTQHAVEHGNLGLIEWLEKNHVHPSKTLLNTLSLLAARFGHWHVVEHFCTHYPLKQVTINTLLHLAATQQAPEIIPSLFQINKHSPHIKSIEQAFTKAVLLEDTATVQALLCCPTPPCDTILTKCFKQALNLKPRQFSIATRIAESTGHHPCLIQAINQAFLDAARHNHLGILLCLKHFKTDALTQETLDTALIRAVRTRHIGAAQFICDFKHIKPRPSAINTALQHAKKIQHPELMMLLSHPASAPSSAQQKRRKNKTKATRPLNASAIPMLRTISCDNLGDQSPLLRNSLFHSPKKTTEAKKAIPSPTKLLRTQST